MSRLFNLASQIKTSLRSGGRSAYDTQARQFFNSETEDEDPVGRVSRALDRVAGNRGYGRHYNAEDWQYLKSGMRYVSSSNVYGYAFDLTTSRQGVLYVQFLNWVPKQFGGNGSKSGPGPTYAYFGVPLVKFHQFESLARTSAGSAVWDYLRVRHSAHAHQHQYQLVQVSGDYVPRKNTAWGARGKSADGTFGRSVAEIGIGNRNPLNTGRQMLPSRQSFSPRQSFPPRNTGTPNRGTPNRGEPNRG